MAARGVRLAVAVLVAAPLGLTACGGVPQACVDAAVALTPAAVAFVDDLPAGLAATPAEELRVELDERDDQTLDQVLLVMNRLGLGGIDPAPGQDPAEVRAGLRLAREADCTVGDMRPTLADGFARAASSADGGAAARYTLIAEALRPATD